jgi:uncharacterized membrane protein YeaQ/YmgE (transglycosylase-associated protein family)
MGFLSWIIVGLIAGIIAKLIMGDSFGWIITIVLGIVGAFVGGWAFSLFGGPSVTGINLMSILVAVVGAVIVLAIYGLIVRRR